MSAFLGPIHEKMYGRVLYQDRLAQAVIDLSEKSGWTEGLQEQVSAAAPAASDQPLETIIDPGNIHGWLSVAVSQCERRFALAVDGALKGHPERLDMVKKELKDMGRAHSLSAGIDAETAFQAIHDLLLDGMPCDFPFVVTESGADAVVWQVAHCPHSPFWTETECGGELYYQLRDAWVEGALEGSGILHTRTEPNTHALRKEH